MAPTIGSIVIFKLAKDQAEEITSRRTHGPSKRDKHTGRFAFENEEYPMIVVRVWEDEFGPGKHGVNGQVFLDGDDTFWVTSASEGTQSGQWHWPAAAK